MGINDVCHKMETNAHVSTCKMREVRPQQICSSFWRPTKYDFKIHQWITMNKFTIQSPGHVMRAVSVADGKWVVLWTVLHFC